MTDNLRELEQRMQRATAPRFEAGSEMDPETASLRAGWLALDELLEAAQKHVAPPMCCVPFAPLQRRKHWWLARVAALAAAVLIAVAAISYMPGTKPEVAPSPRPMDVAATTPKTFAGGTSQFSSAANGTVPLKTRDSQTTAAGSNEAEIAWDDDALDQEVESAGLAIQKAQMDQFAFASASSRIQYQLEDLKNEIENSPL